MNRTNVLLFALMVAMAPGCAKNIKTSHRGEPADPNGDELAKKAADAAVEKLLAQTVLHFGFDEAQLSAADQAALKKVADAVKPRPWIAIRIGGHADERGTEEYNLALGQRRADTARAYLVALGLSEEQVETVTFGEEVPALNAQNEEAYAANRRDEFGVMPLDLFSYVEHSEGGK